MEHKPGAESSQKNKKQKETLLKTVDALGKLRASLKEAGFNPKEPDLKTAWEVFKKFNRLRFDCSDDSLLFEAGVYDVTGEEQFYLSMVRQFTIEVDGEYDYMEQIHLDLIYPADDRLGSLNETLWTYDFDDDIPAFIAAVEESPAFNIALEEYHALASDIYQDEI